MNHIKSLLQWDKRQQKLAKDFVGEIERLSDEQKDIADGAIKDLERIAADKLRKDIGNE